VAALLVVEVASFAVQARAGAGPMFLAQPDAATFAALRARARAYLRQAPVDSGGLRDWLAAASAPVFSLTDATGRFRPHLYAFPQRDTQTLLLLDPDWRVLAVTPEGRRANANGVPAGSAPAVGVPSANVPLAGVPPVGATFPFHAYPLPADLMTELAKLPRASRVPSLLNASPETRFDHDRRPTWFLYPDPANARMILVTPVFGAEDVFGAEGVSGAKDASIAEEAYGAQAPPAGGSDELLGVLMVLTNATATPPLTGGLLVMLNASVLAFTIAAGAVGMTFSALTARALVRRLRALVDTTAAWGQGDFGRPVHDAAEDEIGALAAHLNLVRGQIQDVLAARQQVAALEERNRLARDLHDSVKQQVFAINLNLGTAQLVWERDPAAARARLDGAADLARQAARELAALIQTLRPTSLDGRPLEVALADLAKAWASQAGLHVTCDVRAADPVPGSTDFVPPLPRAAAEALYRVAQEGLANVARHSGARAARVDLVVGRDEVLLAVSDDGRGFDPGQTSTGFGLRSMRERVEKLGGRWAVASGPRGTQLEARVPIPPNDDPTVGTPLDPGGRFP